MLPSGPRSTYSLPPTPHATPDAVARQMIATIRDMIARSNGVRTGTMTVGCDGSPVINPLDGTSCNGDQGQKVLFNPQTRTVLATIGRQANGIVKTTSIVQPASCATITAALRARRRFRDNLGNEYGPDGAWLSHSNPPAVLNPDYTHKWMFARRFDTTDSGDWHDLYHPWRTITLEKVAGIPATLTLNGPVESATPGDSPAGGAGLPGLNDLAAIARISFHSGVNTSPTHWDMTGLDDATFGGTSYDFSVQPALFSVKIDGTGGLADTFQLELVWGTSYTLFATGVPITGAAQSLAHGAEITFGAKLGHTMGDTWVHSVERYNQIVRPGVAARGSIVEATACVNGGFPNNNVMVTSEDDLGVTHALVVRDADSLAELYRKTNHTGITNASGERLSFSTNDEGLFFAHFYTSDGSRKVVVISVNPLTFEPTITEVITLETNGYTGSTGFAVALTA